MRILTRRFELPEVDVDQDEVDDRRAVLFSFLWFEDVAFLQALAVKDFGVDLGERELVHPSPLLRKQKLLGDTFYKLDSSISRPRRSFLWHSFVKAKGVKF